jgi:hypothetical protein
LVLVAALLIVEAIDTQRHRWFNLVIVALMVGGLTFDWLRGRTATERGGPLPSIDVGDALLDERRELSRST